ncbi:branched-chain amino acid ABC transporter permease [Azospirillum sp. ST 5-10]|uniref:branched-chain amino acid ABC transporter permease n=1 Tax=unclassified Azospirillum TaxID=2630922 RepID=UPI003F49CFA7
MTIAVNDPAARAAAPARPARPDGAAVAHVALAALLLAFPLAADDFWTVQVAAQTFFLGTIALSLMWVGGHGGMVSLAQLTVAGVAGYTLAILGTSNADTISLGWPWWVAVPLALLAAVLFATLTGMLAARTEGIYTIMITLAIAVAFALFCRQNYALFNGFNGFASLAPPAVAGVGLREPVPFYYLCLAVAALAYGGVTYLARSTFGLALQGVRDNPRRMLALGFNVYAHRVAAYALSGLIAGAGGLLFVWFNSRISPDSIDAGPSINVLIMAVLGGMVHPIGPYVGALAFILLQNFAIDLVDPERFNLVIGGAFLAIVLASPDGLVGLWRKLSGRRGGPAAADATQGRTRDA